MNMSKSSGGSHSSTRKNKELNELKTQQETYGNRLAHINRMNGFDKFKRKSNNNQDIQMFQSLKKPKTEVQQ
jgi:hypothetical protein